MPAPLHTPYDGSTKPFTLALQTLNPDDWIEVDDQLTAQLGEKDHLFANEHARVFVAEPASVEAQAEVLSMLMAYLPEHYPELYSAEGETITIKPTNRTYNRSAYADRPLELAARLIQDDLVLMRKEDGEHRLVAAALCFPSSWLLAEKFGKPMADIHGPVPGFGRGGRTAERIERVFSNLKPDQPVQRFNWSLYDSPDLFYPERSHTKSGLFDEAGAPNIWLRVERQTLRRMPLSGDILFTIKICVDPLAALQDHADGARLAEGLKTLVEAMDADQTAYKGLTGQRAQVVAALNRIVT
ncbi:MAG: DUF3445 domain-containing protein [Pseudomonadota bacterium]